MDIRPSRKVETLCGNKKNRLAGFKGETVIERIRWDNVCRTKIFHAAMNYRENKIRLMMRVRLPWLARLSSLAAVETPRSAARSRDIKKNKAVEDGGIAPIEDGEEAFSGVNHPVGHRHIAREDKGGKPRK